MTAIRFTYFFMFYLRLELLRHGRCRRASLLVPRRNIRLVIRLLFQVDLKKGKRRRKLISLKSFKWPTLAIKKKIRKSKGGKRKAIFSWIAIKVTSLSRFYSIIQSILQRRQQHRKLKEPDRKYLSVRVALFCVSPG